MPDNGFGTKANSRSFLLRVNDTNFGSRGRNPSLPDYSDFIVVDVPGVPSR